MYYNYQLGTREGGKGQNINIFNQKSLDYGFVLPLSPRTRLFEVIYFIYFGGSRANASEPGKTELKHHPIC